MTLREMRLESALEMLQESLEKNFRSAVVSLQGLILAEYGLLAEKGKEAAEKFDKIGSLDCFQEFGAETQKVERLVGEINDCFCAYRDNSANIELLKRLRDLALAKEE